MAADVYRVEVQPVEERAHKLASGRGMPKVDQVLGLVLSAVLQTTDAITERQECSEEHCPAHRGDQHPALASAPPPTPPTTERDQQHQ